WCGAHVTWACGQRGDSSCSASRPVPHPSSTTGTLVNGAGPALTPNSVPSACVKNRPAAATLASLLRRVADEITPIDKVPSTRPDAQSGIAVALLRAARPPGRERRGFVRRGHREAPVVCP